MPEGKNIPTYYGEGGRLKSSAAPELVASAYAHDCADAGILLPGLHTADIAHAVALAEAGVIPGDAACKLLKGLIEISSIAPEDFPVEPELGDAYNSKDAALRVRIGDDAGWVHAGRPRREAVNVAYLLAVRERWVHLAETLGGMLGALTDAAEKYRDVLMPDFTYLHHAHPTTLGHYLLTFAYPLQRDIQRLQQAWERLDACPAGSGSVNGTRLPVDRARLAELLGFGHVAPHTRDAMWQPDVPLECMAVAVSAMTNLSRLADELQVWNTAEFDLVELPDAYCRASVIMPQKKNPYPLAYIRGLANDLLGRLSSFAALGKVISGNPDSRIFVYGELPRALDRVSNALDLFAAIIDEMKPNRERMLARLAEGFSNATDIADILITECNMDYRTAHQIVGRTVRDALDAGKKGYAITADDIAAAAEAATGKRIGITPEMIAPALDAKAIVASRKTTGGAAMARVDEQIAQCHAVTHGLENWIAARIAQRETAFGILEKAVSKTIG